MGKIAALSGELRKVPGLGILVALGLLLVGINGLGVWGIIYSGREARQEVLKDLELQAIAGARTLEAALASTRADFVFLSQSPLITKSAEAVGLEDPMARRWRRLDIEATLLLFVSSHPEVERVDLVLEGEGTIIRAGRRDGAPTLLPVPDSARAEELAGEEYLRGRWALGEGSRGYLDAMLSIPALLGLSSPTQDYTLSLEPVDSAGADAVGGSEESLSTTVAVRDTDWSPPIDWAITWSERRGGLVESVGRLTSRYRMTLTVNLLLMGLAAGLGLISIRQVRKGMSLELENRQQAQIRELERQAMHTERLASVGRMAAGLAHEINNPLEGMANYLVLLEDDIRNGEKESSLEFVKRIREGLKRTAGVTRRVLTLSEPGHKPMTRVDVQAILSETVDFVSGNAIFRNMEMGTRFLDGPVPVRGNPVTLGQVFLNLLLNAAEVQGGRGRCMVRVEIEGEEVLLHVEDEGPGIEAGILPRIFEPFASGRGSTGLGLSICRNIMDQHGGAIEAANRAQGGAVFTIRLPRLASDSQAVEDDAIAPARERAHQYQSVGEKN